MQGAPRVYDQSEKRQRLQEAAEKLTGLHRQKEKENQEGNWASPAFYEQMEFYNLGVYAETPSVEESRLALDRTLQHEHALMRKVSPSPRNRAVDLQG